MSQLNKSGAGYVHSCGDHIAATMFVDDTCLLAQGPRQAQTLINEVSRFAEWAHMEVTLEKTQVSAYDFASDQPLLAHTLCFTGKDGIARPLPPLAIDQPYKYLCNRLTLTLNWKYEKSSVRERVKAAIEYLRDTAYTYTQMERVVRTCIAPVFQYSSAIAPWSHHELVEMSALFDRAMRKAWEVS